jgi:hypothetical protein
VVSHALAAFRSRHVAEAARDDGCVGRAGGRGPQYGKKQPKQSAAKVTAAMRAAKREEDAKAHEQLLEQRRKDARRETSEGVRSPRSLSLKRAVCALAARIRPHALSPHARWRA